MVVEALVVSTTESKRANAQSGASPRTALLTAIERRAGKDEVASCLDALIQSPKPTSSNAPLSSRIDGKWELIWSIGDENFSPLLRLPPPLKPGSYQYVGSEAAREVGEGRIAQLLTGGVFGETKAWLSSGVVPVKGKEEDTLEIRPPFRLELETSPSKPRRLLVDAGSDADFRAVNARTTEAQRAPPNLYQQLYLEDNGPGSLRVSKIIEGDPVIVGAVLVHRKL